MQKMEPLKAAQNMEWLLQCRCQEYFHGRLHKTQDFSLLQMNPARAAVRDSNLGVEKLLFSLQTLTDGAD